jgi:G3E family GTPase
METMNEGHVDLWILGGFLGAGKTTVLNNLLERVRASAGARGTAGPRIGVVVNDFGEVGVDASLLRRRTHRRGTGGESDAAADNNTGGQGAAQAGVTANVAGTEAEAPEVVELNGGQIFCACLSGSFVRSMTELVERGVDVLLVESSGLAKPSPLADIISAAVEATAGRLCYRGFVCVVDAVRFPKLEKTVNAVPEQVVKADLVVVNKVDLVEPEQVAAVTTRVHELNPAVRVLERSGGALSVEELRYCEAGRAEGGATAESAVGARNGSSSGESSEQNAGLQRSGFRTFRGWGSAGRPVAVTWRLPGGLSAEALREALGEVAPRTHRIKGYAYASQRRWLINAVEEAIEMHAVDSEPQAGQAGAGDINGKEHNGAGGVLTVIAPAEVELGELLEDAIPHSRCC